MSDDNKANAITPLVTFITIASLVALGIVGAVLIILLRPDATATFTQTFITIIGLAITFAGTAGVVRPMAKRIQVVEKQTNGTLSKKDEEIKKLQAQIISMGGNPHE